MIEHENDCLLKLVQCEYCENNFHLNDLQHHKDNVCDYKHIECIICKNYIYRKDIRNHVNNHYNDIVTTLYNAKIYDNRLY